MSDNNEDINIEQINNIADKSEDIGNKCYAKFNSKGKLESAKVAISAYRNTLYANSLLIKNKKV